MVARGNHKRVMVDHMATTDPQRRQGRSDTLRKAATEARTGSSALQAGTMIERAVLDMLHSGQLAPGDRLGAERDLAERFGVTRFTVRRGLDALERAGIVLRVPGRKGGTFIAQQKVTRDLSEIAGLPEYLSRQGFASGTNVISARLVSADQRVSENLNISPGAPVCDLVRIRLADGLPISLEHGILPADRFPGLLQHPLGGSVMQLLVDHYGLDPSRSVERIEVVPASTDEARLLDVEPRSPVLSIERVSYTKQGWPYEYSLDQFRADRTQITVLTEARDKRLTSSGNAAQLRLTVAPK